MAIGRKTGGGSRAGIPNKVTAEFRETVSALLDDNRDNVHRWLTEVAEGEETKGVKPDPGKALDLMAKLAEYAAPKLGRIEHVGDKGKPIQVAITNNDRAL